MNKYALGFIILSFLNFGIKFLGTSSYVHIDEPIYVAAGIKLLHPESNLEEDNPMEFNFQHPPLAEVIIGLPSLFYSFNYSYFKALRPNSYIGLGIRYMLPAVSDLLFSARILSVIFGTLSSVIIYFFVLKLTKSDSKALLAYALIIVSPPMLLLSSTALLDIYFLFFFLLSLYFFTFYFEKEPNTRNSLILSLLVGVTVLSRNFIPFILLPSLFVFSKNKKRIFIISVIAFLIYFFFYLLPSLGLINLIFSERASSSLGLLGILLFFPKFVSSVSIAMLCLLTLYIYSFFTKRKKFKFRVELKPLLLSILLLGLLTFFINPFETRYLLIAFPLSIIIVSSKFKFTKFSLSLFLLSLIFTLMAVPHFEYSFNPFKAFFPGERDDVILIHSFLDERGYENVLTDYYPLLLMNDRFHTALFLSEETVCNNESLFIEYFDAYIISEGFFTNEYDVEHLVPCPALINLVSNNLHSIVIGDNSVFEPNYFQVIS